MKIVNVEEMRRIEQLTDANGQSYAAMMEMAGREVAEAALGLQMVEPGDSVLVLVGPGNNGGDGLVAARFLRERGHDIVIYIWKRDIKGDENFRLLKRRRRGIAILWAENDTGFVKLREEVSRTSLIVDALLGTGVSRPLDGRLVELLSVVTEEIAQRRRLEAEEAELQIGAVRMPLVEAAMHGNAPTPPRTPLSDPEEEPAYPLENDDDEDDPGDAWDDLDDAWLDDEEDYPMWPPAPVLAVDCPSGLNCDTGEIDEHALTAQATVTFAYPKWGQLQFPGAGACGLLYVADIGVPERFANEVAAELVGPRQARQLMPARLSSGHKGSFGKVLVAGGSLQYTGAVVLAAGAAARSGAGLVTAAIPLPLHAAVAGHWAELTWLPLPGPNGTHTAEGAQALLAAAGGYDALLIGPGLTTSPEAQAFVRQVLGTGGLDGTTWRGRAVIDADALNTLALLPDWPARLPPGSVLTPHPGEMARLTGLDAGQVNARRIMCACENAVKWGHVVLLKGPHTVVASPEGRIRVLPFATSALATAGSGDVLAGVIASLIAQGLAAFDAATLGAYLHGAAGVAIELAVGTAGGTARDILARIPDALRKTQVA